MDIMVIFEISIEIKNFLMKNFPAKQNNVLFRKDIGMIVRNISV